MPLHVMTLPKRLRADFAHPKAQLLVHDKAMFFEITTTSKRARTNGTGETFLGSPGGVKTTSVFVVKTSSRTRAIHFLEGSLGSREASDR